MDSSLTYRFVLNTSLKTLYPVDTFRRDLSVLIFSSLGLNWITRRDLLELSDIISMRESIDNPTARVEKAGCVPIRRTPAGVWEVLVVESRWSTDTWLFPKGSIEEGETALAAATRETVEEAGVLGDTTVCLGCWVIPTRQAARTESLGTALKDGKEVKDKRCVTSAVTGSKRPQRLQMWLLAVSTELNVQDCRWIEATQRRRRWASFPRARVLLATSQRPELLQMLDAAHGAVSTGRLTCAPLPCSSPRPHQRTSRLSV